MIAEPVQGEGGVRVLSKEFLRGLRELTRAHGVALIFDEVQCGLGRTGKLFAYEYAGVEPDMMTLAKPLAGGLPMGAVLLAAWLRGFWAALFVGVLVLLAAAPAVDVRVLDHLVVAKGGMRSIGGIGLDGGD